MSAGTPQFGDMSEAQWEAFAMETLAELAWVPMNGKQIAPGSGERLAWDELIIPGRLRDAIARLNPHLPESKVADAVGTVLSATSQDALAENQRIHDFLTRGIRSVTWTDDRGEEHNPTVRLVDFQHPEANDFLAVQQVTVVRGKHRRRFDIVLYLNGLPVALLELKKATDKYAELKGAQRQIETYVEEFPLAFRANVVCAVSDGITARYGTAFTPFEHYATWNVDDDGTPVPQPGRSDDELALNLLLHGLFNQRRFLELLRGYVAFADLGDRTVKRIAKPHQYFVVRNAVGRTLAAVNGDTRAGVVWHTQGSGKSLEMELYTYQILTHPQLANPTVVVITDRTDLDDQLFTGFAASALLPEQPVQVATRDELRTALASRTTGGIIFTTLQKFGRRDDEKKARKRHPLLSDRRNIVVIVDEAHRSHYVNLKDGKLDDDRRDDLGSYAVYLRQALPNATMIAFTGTPISKADKDTRMVFGDYIPPIYDLTRAVEDGATVRVYYDSRHIPVALPPGVDPERVDEHVESVTAGLDDAEQEKIQRAVAVMNAVYGAPDRLKKLAADIVEHWEARSGDMRQYIDGPGKGMIVCATRNICARLYAEITALRPDWHDDADDKGLIKVVYTGDPSEKDAAVRPHIRRPSQTKVIQRRAKDAKDPLQLVIVQSMWLTGFDSPPMHTMYLDRPMHGAALMQALARVNRTYRAKPAGLLVGYAPITQHLHEALAEYTADDQDNKPIGRDIEHIIGRLRDTHTALCAMLKEHDWRADLGTGTSAQFRRAVLGTVEYLRDPALPANRVEPPEEPLAQRYRISASRLERYYALCATHGDVNDLRDDIGFFRAVRIWMAKFDVEDRRSRGLPVPAEIELYLRQYTDGMIEAGKVVDIYDAAGIAKPDLSHLDKAYLAKLRESKTPNLAIEALRRAIEQTMRRNTRHNVVRQRSYSERLVSLMNRYTNQQLSAAEILAEFVEIAQEVSGDANRGRQFDPPLTDDELAFYDAVAQNKSAFDVMGSGVLADIARDLVKSVRNSITVDWMSRENVRAKLRSTIKRLLAKHGYPPDAQPAAIELVIQQMETFAEEWAPQAA